MNYNHSTCKSCCDSSLDIFRFLLDSIFYGYFPNHKKDRSVLSYKPFKYTCDVIVEESLLSNLSLYWRICLFKASVHSSEYNFNPHPLLYSSINSVKCVKREWVMLIQGKLSTIYAKRTKEFAHTKFIT